MQIQSPCSTSALPTDPLIVQEASKDSRYEKIDKNSRRWSRCCMLTKIGICSIASGGIYAGIEAVSLLYYHDFIITTPEIVFLCSSAGVFGAVYSGITIGVTSWMITKILSQDG